jgi:hypothetical protein
MKAICIIVFTIYSNTYLQIKIKPHLERGLLLLLLLLLLLFLTAVGFSPAGSSLTPVQAPQYNNTYINGTAQITLHVLAVHPHNTMYLL